MAYTTRFGKLVRIGGYVHPQTKQPVPDPKLKGRKGKNCNRTHCQKPGAVWYNHGSLAWYCGHCARDLNEDRFNKREAQETWGHPLCTLDPEAVAIHEASA